jgi:hypothetical protein
MTEKSLFAQMNDERKSFEITSNYIVNDYFRYCLTHYGAMPPCSGQLIPDIEAAIIASQYKGAIAGALIGLGLGFIGGFLL